MLILNAVGLQIRPSGCWGERGVGWQFIVPVDPSALPLCLHKTEIRKNRKMRQFDNSTIRQMPFSAFRILGVSFLILYIYYNIYII